MERFALSTIRTLHRSVFATDVMLSDRGNLLVQTLTPRRPTLLRKVANGQQLQRANLEVDADGYK